MSKQKIRRAKGEGSLRLRKDNRWEASVTLDGKRQYFYGKTKGEAIKKMSRFKELTEETSANTCFDKYFYKWLYLVKKPRLKPSSFDRIERTYINYLKNRLGAYTLNDIKSELCQRIIDESAQKYSYSTVKKIHELLRACLEYAVNIGDLSRNPLSVVSLPREAFFPKKTKTIFIPSEDDLQAYWREAERQYSNGKYVYFQNYVFAYRLLALTGCRCGELLALKYSNIDFDKATARIESSISEIRNRKGNADNRIVRIETETKTKNGKRQINLNSEALEILQKLYEQAGKADDSYIVSNCKGNQATYHDLQRTHGRICKNSGVKPWGLHTFRHLFASKCIANGVEILALSKHLGHANSTITLSTYAHLTESQNEKFKKLLEAIKTEKPDDGSKSDC